jgi:hypothetical protein
MSGPQLAEIVILPATARIDAASLRRAFGVTKQCISLWRINHDFPPCEGRGASWSTDTARVAAWVNLHGSGVRWI